MSFKFSIEVPKEVISEYFKGQAEVAKHANPWYHLGSFFKEKDPKNNTTTEHDLVKIFTSTVENSCDVSTQDVQEKDLIEMDDALVDYIENNADSALFSGLDKEAVRIFLFRKLKLKLEDEVSDEMEERILKLNGERLVKQFSSVIPIVSSNISSKYRLNQEDVCNELYSRLEIERVQLSDMFSTLMDKVPGVGEMFKTLISNCETPVDDENIDLQSTNISAEEDNDNDILLS